MSQTIDPVLLDTLLDRWPVARLATWQAVDRDAKPTSPHQVPIVFCRHGKRLYSPLDGKTKGGRELKRFRNIRQNPAVSLLLDHYDQDWRALWWLRIDATATRLDASPDDEAMLAPAFRKKYPQYAQVPLHRDEPIYMRFEIDAVNVWGQTDAEASIRASLAHLIPD